MLKSAIPPFKTGGKNPGMGSDPSLFHASLSGATAQISAAVARVHAGMPFASRDSGSTFRSCSAH